MALNKLLLQLFCFKNKDSKKKGKSIDPLWQASALPSTVNATATNSYLESCSSGTGALPCVQNHEAACSNMTSVARTDQGIENNDYRSFVQFDVVQNFSDHHFANSSPGKTTKEWVKAVQSEWNLLQKNLPEYIYVRVYEERIDLLRAAIVGPEGTPYHDGLFFFDVRFPPEYPKCPPKVHYHSGGLRLNPNLYESGKVCLSLLNTWWGTGCEKWDKSNSTLLQVLVSIQGLVLNEKPYYNEPGNINSANTAIGEKYSLAYNQTAFILSCKTMLYSITNPPKNFETLVAFHFHERETAIREACAAYMQGIIVGSWATCDTTRYARDKCFADFSKSLAMWTEQLKGAFAANRARVLELEREAASSADEIVPA